MRLMPYILALLGVSFIGGAEVAHAQAHIVEAESGESDFMMRLRKVAEEIETRLLREDPNPVGTDSGGNSGGSDASSGGNETGEADSGGSEAYGYDAETPSTPVSQPRGNSSDASKSIRRPPDIRPSQDETIIMKNIREAAEQETDSKIREKLWDEYRQYQKEL